MRNGATVCYQVRTGKNRTVSVVQGGFWWCDLFTWLDFSHFKRRKQANLPVGGTGRPEVPAYRGWLLDFVQLVWSYVAKLAIETVDDQGAPGLFQCRGQEPDSEKVLAV